MIAQQRRCLSRHGLEPSAAIRPEYVTSEEPALPRQG
jgi:hypothetical protein